MEIIIILYDKNAFFHYSTNVRFRMGFEVFFVYLKNEFQMEEVKSN